MLFTKIFSSIYDGTLGGDWKALVTFQQFLILSDHEGYLDMTPEAIHRMTSIPLDIIKEGIDKLSQPDPHSRTSLQEGRRIILIDPERSWGWIIVNKQKYMNISSHEDKKERDRIRIAEKRKKIKDVAKCSQVLPSVADVAQVELDRELDKDKTKDLKPFVKHAFDSVLAKTGSKLLIQGKDTKIVKRLLGTYQIEELKTLWDKFINSTDPFIQKAGLSIGVFSTQINKLLTQVKAEPTGMDALKAIRIKEGRHNAGL